VLIVVFFQSAVTGEHTCMVLRPLNSDDIEVSESNKCGFLDPFYQGMKFFHVLFGIICISN